MTCKVDREATTVNLAFRSLYLISNLVELSEDEAQARAQAIATHDGVYPVFGGVNNLDYHHKHRRLRMIVHFAVMWTDAVDEEGRTWLPNRAVRFPRRPLRLRVTVAVRWARLCDSGA